MTTLTLNRALRTAAHGPFGRFGRGLKAFLGALREARQMADRYDYLSRRTDSELARMGITRKDIPQLVASGH